MSAEPHDLTGHSAPAGHAPGVAHDVHGDAHDAHGAHGGEDMGLGPVDARIWLTGLLGAALGLVGALAFAISTGYLRLS